jgi:hypothetical protein
VEIHGGKPGAVAMKYIGIWECVHNPDFNSIEFEGIKNMSSSRVHYH